MAHIYFGYAINFKPKHFYYVCGPFSSSLKIVLSSFKKNNRLNLKKKLPYQIINRHFQIFYVGVVMNRKGVRIRKAKFCAIHVFAR